MPKPYRKNPRKITQKQLENLETTLAELGDLSGIVHDLGTDEIVGGNQRSKVFRLDECEIVLTEEYAQPDEQGTVGLGFVVWRGKHYAYRAVRWDERTAERANIVANRAGGSWDFEMLAQEFSAPDLVEWGFEPGEVGLTPADGYVVSNLREGETHKIYGAPIQGGVEVDRQSESAASPMNDGEKRTFFDATALAGSVDAGETKVTLLIYLTFSRIDEFREALSLLSYGNRGAGPDGQKYAVIDGDHYLPMWKESLNDGA